MSGRGGAAERVLRVVALLFGLAAIVFGLISLGAILGQLAEAPPWWTALALLAILGTSAALGAAAPFAPARVLRGLAASVALGYLGVALTLPFAVAPQSTTGAAPWPLGLTALGTTAAALAFRPSVAWASTVALGVTVAVDRVATARGDLLGTALQDAAYATFFAAVFVALTLGALAAGRRVDAAAADADRAAVTAAVERVRQDERARVDALVHDRVLATLLLAARRVPGSGRAVREQAAAALTTLQLLADDGHAVAPVTAVELADRVRNQVTQLAPWAGLEVLRDEAPADLPATAAEALLGALGEALRNAVQHAGDRAEVAVRLEDAEGGVVITVVDDGAGFETREVPPGRLGITASIVGRLAAVGGEGLVRSRPGLGTAVRLTWSRR